MSSTLTPAAASCGIMMTLTWKCSPNYQHINDPQLFNQSSCMLNHTWKNMKLQSYRMPFGWVCLVGWGKRLSKSITKSCLVTPVLNLCSIQLANQASGKTWITQGINVFRFNIYNFPIIKSSGHERTSWLNYHSPGGTIPSLHQRHP